MKVLITGGLGFIGTNMVLQLMNNKDIEKIYIIDKKTYASNETITNLIKNKKTNITLYINDIRNIYTISDELKDVNFCIHLAAESHVDKSLNEMKHFIDINASGTYEVAKFCFENDIKMIHFSTDEVYGELPLTIDESERFEEIYSKTKPRNPYSVSKLFAEHMIDLAEIETGVYINCIKIRPCNQFGPYQDTTKFIPKLISNISNNIKTPLYGNGDNIREWMFVTDTCRIIEKLMEMWEIGCPLPLIMNIGSGNDISNYNMTSLICDFMNVSVSDVITYIKDPRGNCHDKRYSVNNSIMKKYMGPDFNYTEFEDAIRKTIGWYTQ